MSQQQQRPLAMQQGQLLVDAASRAESSTATRSTTEHDSTPPSKRHHHGSSKRANTPQAAAVAVTSPEDDVSAQSGYESAVEIAGHYPIEEVLDYCVVPQYDQQQPYRSGLLFFLVQWKGWPLSSAEWLPADNIPIPLQAPFKADIEFERARGQRRRPVRSYEQNSDHLLTSIYMSNMLSTHAMREEFRANINELRKWQAEGFYNPPVASEQTLTKIIARRRAKREKQNSEEANDRQV